MPNVLICAAASLLAAPLPAPAQFVNPANGHTYYASSDFIHTFAEAEAWAQSLGGHLVAINDQAENDWLTNTFGTSQEYWIGLTDSEDWGGHEAGSDPWDGWVWMSGEPLTYVNWYPGEPNNDDGVEDYVELNYLFTDHRYWNDVREPALLIALAEVVPAPGSLTVVALAAIASHQRRRIREHLP
jgi:hypothetical protein